MPTRNSIRAAKPAKPYPEFPLFAHATGRWAKKIRGRMHYFGKWEDPDTALAKYMAEKDALHRGLTPADTSDGATLFLLCGKFLTTKKRLVETGDLSPRSLADYTETCKRLLKVFGRHRLVAEVRPGDFERLRAKMAKTWGPVRLGNEINRTRIVFNYAYKNGLLDKPMVYGEGFRRPAKKRLRKHKRERGTRSLTADEIRRLLAGVCLVPSRRHLPTVQLKAMILLGINCAFGNSDVAMLPLSALDLKRGWANYPRPKTGIERRCPLWPETVVALKEWLAVRPSPKNPEHSERVFITKQGGTWEGDNQDRPVSKECGKLLAALNIDGHRNFYALRHSFQTVGDDTLDFVAVGAIMGHESDEMANAYRDGIPEHRLRAVAEHIRTWLFGSSR